MASQEFLASFAVEIDEGGVSRLQEVLAGNRQLAEDLAAAFGAASEAIRAFTDELSALPGFSSAGITEEGFSGLGGLALGLDTAAAEKDLSAFLALAKKPVSLTANASGIVSAARTAYNSVKSLFASPFTVRASAEAGGGDGGNAPGTGVKMSSGGRFSRPTDVQVAEDGDAEYIIPVKKEDRAVPLLRQLLSEISPAARANLFHSEFRIQNAEWDGPGAGSLGAGSVSMDNRTVSAPVNIQVHASGTDAERIGRSLYDTAERYLLRTLRSTTV